MRFVTFFKLVKLLFCAVVRKMMAELFPSLEQELTNFEVFGIQIDTT